MQKTNLLLASTFIWAATNSPIILSQAQAEENTYGPVKQGELISNIAGKVVPNSSVSRQQVILSLLKANPQAFKLPCNFNSLKVGQKLQIPSLSEIQTLSQTDAKTEYNRQNEEWKKRRQQPIVCPTQPSAPTAETVTPPASKPETTPATVTAEKSTTAPTPSTVSPPPPANSAETTPPTTPPTAPTAPSTTPAAPPTTAPAAPPTAPVVSPSPSQSAPKTEAKLVPEDQNHGDQKTTEPQPVTTPPSSPPSGVTPPTTSSERAPRISSELTLGLLTVGGLLSILIIGGLVYKLRHQSDQPEEPAGEKEAFSLSETPEVVPDDMPLHTIKAPEGLKEEDKFRI